MSRQAAEAVESFGDLVAEARTELEEAEQQKPVKEAAGSKGSARKKASTVSEVTVE